MDKPKSGPVIHERPKMPRATWEALRNHIISERKRKQEEEEKSEEYERLKKEREYRKKQEATSLEETKDQISDLERKLSSLKDEKHQLFLTLKKVLNEDETRRRKETDEMNILYGAPQHNPPVMPLSGHAAHNQHIYMNPASRQPSHYMKPHLPGMPPVAQVKRPRTPSPPRAPLASVNSAYYRSAPLSHGRLPVSSVYGHPSASSTGAATYAMSSSNAAYPFPVTQTSREEERKQVYLSQSNRYMQQMASAAAAKSESLHAAAAADQRDRSRLGLPHSQAVALSASRPSSGSITSGFPLRSSANLASVASSFITTGAPSLPARLAYTQAAAQLAASQHPARFYPNIRDHQ